MITEAIFNSILPNIMAPVKGEQSVFNKMQQFLKQSQLWVIDKFVGSTLFASLESREDTDTTKIIVQHVIVYDAFARGIPSLDLILTPNGFGIVNNTNVAPASKERVERLIASMYNNRDISINALLQQLPSENGWQDTDQGKFFGSTMFPDMAVERIEPIPESFHTKFDHYLDIRVRMMLYEQTIAEQYISEELMTALRGECQQRRLTGMRRTVIQQLQAVEISIYKSEGFTPAAHHSLSNIVNVIRNNSTIFPQWQNSATAKLYDPPIYENKKEDTGYWF